MGNMHRIVWIDTEIRLYKFPNVRKISEKFEISERQAQRDIEYLRSSLGAPLVYDAKKYGYIYEDQTYILPQIYLTKEQRKVLSYLAYRYENHQKNNKITQVAELLKRISSDELLKQETKLPIFQYNDELVSKIELLIRGMNTRQKIRIRYHNTEKMIHIYHLYQQNDLDYAVAYCEDEDEIRILRVDKMEDVEIQKETYKIKQEYNRTKYEVFPEKAPFTVILRFEEEPAIPMGVTMNQVGALLYEIHFFSTQLMISQLVNNRQWKEIVSPNWLKAAVKEYCNQIINKIDGRV